MSYQVTIGLALGTSKTGLSLEAQPVSTAGVNVGSAITTGFVEYGGGAYSWTGSLPDGHTGGVKFQLSGGGAFQTFAAINPPEVENPDVKTSTRNALAPLDSTATAVAVQTGLTAQGYTPTRAGYLDTLNGLVQAVWDKATSALTTVGSIGKRIADNLDVAVSTRSTYAGGNVTVGGYATGQDPATWLLSTPANKLATDSSGRVTVGSSADKTGYALTPSEHSSIATDMQTGLTAQGYSSVRAGLLDNLDATITSRLAASGYTAPPALASIINGVLDELLSRHTVVGSVGAGIAAASSAGDPWATALPGSYSSGTAGYLLSHAPTPPSVPAIVAGVLNEPLAGHTTAGTVGAGISSAGAAGDPMSVLVPGTYAAGTAGWRLGHLTDVQLQYVSPVLAGGTLTLVSGVAYQAERGNAITFPALTSSAPDLTGATVTLEIAYGPTVLKTWACTVSGPRSAQVITVNDVTVAMNTLEASDTNRYSVWARWADGDADAIPLLAGKCSIQARP